MISLHKIWCVWCGVWCVVWWWCGRYLSAQVSVQPCAHFASNSGSHALCTRHQNDHQTLARHKDVEKQHLPVVRTTFQYLAHDFFIIPVIRTTFSNQYPYHFQCRNQLSCPTIFRPFSCPYHFQSRSNMWEELIQPDCQTAILLAEWHGGREGGEGGGRRGGGLLIPVISSELGVDGGGVEQNDGSGSGTSRSGRWNLLWEWMIFTARRCATRPSHVLILSTRMCVRQGQRCSSVRDTLTRLRNVRATKSSVFTSRRVHDIRLCLYAKSANKSANVQESCKVATWDLQRVCCHHSFHHLWSRHWVSWCSRHWESWCSCCHQFCDDDEEKRLREIRPPILTLRLQFC